jgi:hypothetical protein
MTNRSWLLALALLAMAGNVVDAQRSAPPAWTLTRTEFVDATPAERARVIATLDEIERILGQVPELAEPRGFEILKHVAAGPHAWIPNGPFHYVLGLQFFAPSVRIAGEGRMCLLVDVNLPNGRPTEIRSLQDDAGRDFLLEYPVGEPKPGSTVVYEGLRWDTPQFDRRPGFVTFSTGGVFPWRPVTREEYLRAEILAIDGKAGDQETSYRKKLEKTTYENWIEAATARKHERELVIASMERAQGRAAADELRKTLEQTEREVTANLKAQDDEERARNKEFLATTTDGDRFRAQLAALSPAERRSPTMVMGNGGPLVPADAPGANRLLLPDPEFWRMRRSRTEVHTITVAFWPYQTCGVPAVRDALWKAYTTLDWMAFKRIVERPW